MLSYTRKGGKKEEEKNVNLNKNKNEIRKDLNFFEGALTDFPRIVK